MQLPDIKDLGKVLDLCRKKGVKVFQLGELKIELGDEPIKQYQRASGAPDNELPDPADPWANFPAGELTPEQLTYYSAGGVPGKEPWLNKGEAE
jgi:hypothetical protein